MTTARKQTLTTEDLAVGFDKAETTMTFVQRLFSNLGIVFSSFLPVNSLLMILPYAGAFLIILTLLLDTIALVFDNKKPLSTRIIKATLAAAIIFTAIATLAVSVVYLGYIITAAIAARRLWDMGVAIFNWITKKPDDDNHQRELRGTVAEKSHMVVVSALTIVGLVLISNPVTFIAGVSILIGVAAYLVLDKFEINPLRIIGKKIFGDTFSVPEKVEEKSDRIMELRPFNTKSILVESKAELGTKKVATPTPKRVIAKPIAEKPAVYHSMFGPRMSSNVKRLHDSMRASGLTVRGVA